MLNSEELVSGSLPFQFPRPQVGQPMPTLAEWNQKYVDYILNLTKGKKTAAARILGINRRTLYRRKKPRAASEPSMTQALIPSLASNLPTAISSVVEAVSGMASGAVSASPA